MKHGAKRRWLLSLLIALLLLTAMVLLRPVAGDALFRRGLEAKASWRLDQAARSFAWALRLRYKAAEASLEEALCLQLQGRFEESQEVLAQAPTGAGQDPLLGLRILNAIGTNRFNANEPDGAMEAHEQSLKGARRLGNAVIEADALIGASRVLYHSKGRSVEALSRLRHALQLARKAGDKRLEADALRNIGVVLWWFQGELERPMEDYYRPALRLYRDIGDLSGEATTIANMGLISSYQGDHFGFVKRQNEALAILRRIGDLAGEADYDSRMGSFYARAGNLRKAGKLYSRSLALCSRIGYHLAQNEVENRLADVTMREGRSDEALPMLKRLLARDRQNPVLAKYRLATLAHCYLRSGNPARARKLYLKALSMSRRAQEEDSRFAIALHTFLAEADLALHDLDGAMEAIEQAEKLAQPKPETPFPWRVEQNLVRAEVASVQARRGDVLNDLREAADSEEEAFLSMPTTFSPERRQEIDDRLLRLLMRPDAGQLTAQEAKLVYRFVEQSKLRSFRYCLGQLGRTKKQEETRRIHEEQSLRRLEKEVRRRKQPDRSVLPAKAEESYTRYEDELLKYETERVRPGLSALKQPRLAFVQAALGADTALIEYLFVGDQAAALVVTHRTIHGMLLPSHRTNLQEKVKLLVSLLQPVPEGKPLSSRFVPVAADLRRKLIRPLVLAGFLDGIRRLALVPSGCLRSLPFAVLASRQQNGVRYLVQDFTLFTAPSASFLVTHQQDEAKPTEAGKMLVFGLSAAHPGLPRLPFAETEARTIATLEHAELRLGREATETAFKKVASRFGIIHLATHGLTDPEMPLLSTLVLEESPSDDGSLTIREIANLPLQATLVTLSSCASGLGFSSSGSNRSDVDRIGIIEAFLQAGARSVLATLTPISDQATMKLMQVYYAKLQTLDEAEALAATQREMIRGQISYAEKGRRRSMAHPRYWAAFVLVGAGSH